jgi:hypothetical protein
MESLKSKESLNGIDGDSSLAPAFEVLMVTRLLGKKEIVGSTPSFGSGGC